MNPSSVKAQAGNQISNPIDELVIELAFTASRTSTEMHPIPQKWCEIREAVAKPLEVTDFTLEEYKAESRENRAQMKDGPGIVPVTLKDPTQGRKAENVESVSMIVLDIDSGMSWDEVKRLLHGIESVTHTTFSHTPDHPKLRVIIPLPKPVNPMHAKAILLHLQERFGGRLDQACFDASRMFYLPRCPKDTATLYQTHHEQGELLDPETIDLEKHAHTLAPTMVSTKPKLGTAANSPTFTKVGIGERNSKLASLVGQWLTKGMTEEVVLQSAMSWNSGLDVPLENKEVEQTVQSIIKTTSRKANIANLALFDAVAEMNKQYVFLTDTGQVFRLRDRKVVSMEQMRNTYANKTVIDENTGNRKLTVFDAWLRSSNRFELRNFTLAPGEGTIVGDCLNLWEGWPAVPVAGDASPWCDLVDHIFGKGTPEALYFEQWVAYSIQNPGAKLAVAVVIWSTQQGIGKSLLGESIAQLYGSHATTITAQELHAPFNDWAKGRLFVIGEENSSSDRRADANRLKHLITGSTLHINQKNIPMFEQPNLMNLLFTSNHPDAFHLDGNDRRLFVHAANKAPLPAEFYEQYGVWLKSEAGKAALMHHLLQVNLKGFNPHGHAPHTAARTEMIEMSKTDVERFAADVFTDDFVENVIHAEITSLEALTEHFNRTTKGQRSNPTAISKALRRCSAYSHNRISTTSGRKMLISIRNHDFWTGADKALWADEYEKGKVNSLLSL